MEDNQQCNNFLAEENDQLMDLEVLCQLKEMSIEGNDKGSEDDDFLEEDKPREPVTFDEVNALVGNVGVVSCWQGLNFSDMSCLCRHVAEMSDLSARHVADIWCS